MVQPIPKGYQTLTPHLVVRDAARAIEFYKKAFGATHVSVMTMPGGKIGHAELTIGNSRIMLADEFPGATHSPESLGGTTVNLHLYFKDVDSAFQQALAAGAKVEMPLTDMFWGDRYGKLTDPFGHSWGLATHIKDVTPEEMQKGMLEAFAKMKTQHA